MRNVQRCCLYFQFHGVLCYNVWVTSYPNGRVTSPGMTESHCFRCPHVWQTKTWPAMRPITICTFKILLVLVRNVHCAFSLLHLSYTSLNSFSCFDLMWRFRLLLYSQLYSHWGHFSLLLLLESLLVLSLEILVIFLVEMSMPFSITIEC